VDQSAIDRILDGLADVVLHVADRGLHLAGGLLGLAFGGQALVALTLPLAVSARPLT